MLTLGGTEDEAHRKARELDELSSADFRWQNALFTAGLDPDEFDPDEPLSPALWTDSNASSSRIAQLLDAARTSPTLPLREVARNITGGAGQLHSSAPRTSSSSASSTGRTAALPTVSR